MSRSVIADLENGRRKYVTTAELAILAVALDTVPIALMYPGPYYEKIRVMPKLAEVPEIWAVQWFSGLVESISNVPFDDEGNLIVMPLLAALKQDNNTRRLHRARQALHLDERRNELLRELGRRRAWKKQGQNVSEEEIAGLAEAADDLKRQIDALGELGAGPFYGDDELAGVRRHLTEHGQFPRGIDGRADDGG